jgi:hypothetical protein
LNDGIFDGEENSYVSGRRGVVCIETCNEGNQVIVPETCVPDTIGIVGRVAHPNLEIHLGADFNA